MNIHLKKVKIKCDLNQAKVRAGDIGTITAYLPGEKTFAIFFGPGKWITFFEDEETFLKKIDIAI